MTFRLLNGQLTHKQLRRMRSFLHSYGVNFLPSEHELRLAEKQSQLLVIRTDKPISVRLADLSQPLSAMLSTLHQRRQLAYLPASKGQLWLQLQVDKGSNTTKGLLKIINVEGDVHARNILPLFYYVGDENYAQLKEFILPYLKQMFDFAYPPTVARAFLPPRVAFSADIKLLRITLGLTESSTSSYPCPFCLITLSELRSSPGITQEFNVRTSLQHFCDYFRFRNEHGGDPKFAAEHNSVKHPPPFTYGQSDLSTSLLLGMPVLHVSIGIATKLLKLARTHCPVPDALTARLMELRLSFHQYHGETLIGPQVHRLLHAAPQQPPLYERVLEVVPQSQSKLVTDGGRLIMRQVPLRARFVDLFQLFARAYDLYTLDRFLSAEEVVLLGTHCSSFGRTFHTHFPQESITPKLHILAVEFPRFARQYGTVGLLSEQRIEAMHAEVNQLMRSYAGMGECARKYEQVFHALCRMHCPSVPVFEPPRRRCSKCHEPIAQNKEAHEQCRAIRDHKTS